jgi:fucokinase
MAAALAARDARAVGAALSLYWEQKKGMAPAAEPPEVTLLLRLLREAGLVHGASLTGAGGGGFMVVVLRNAGARGAEEVAALLRRHPQLRNSGFRTHRCAVDTEGLTVAVERAAAE